MLCIHAIIGFGAGGLEGEWDGAVANHEERLVGLGRREDGAGKVCICISMTLDW